MKARLLSYPIFRLTIPMATGIFLSDRFLPDASLLPVFCCAFLVMGCASLVLYRNHRFKGRCWFGILACLVVAVGGACSLLWHREKVRFQWPSDERLYVGTVADVPHQGRKSWQCILDVERMSDGNRWIPVERSIVFRWMPDSLQRTMECGDRICFKGKVSRPFTEMLVSDFDYAAYLEHQGIGGTGMAFAGRWRLLSSDSGFSYRRMALQFRERVVGIFRSWQMGEDELAVISALTVGDKSGLDTRMKSAYQTAGASHVLALSGLHVGILTLLLSLLFRPFDRLPGGRWIRSVCLVAFLWNFAFFSGLSPSVIRSVTMFSLYVLASALSENRFSGFFAVSLTAFMMLVYQPLYLFDVGFQLSFAAVLSIMIFYPVLEKLVGCRFRFLRYFWQTMSLSLAAQLGTLPLILVYFGTFPTYFLVANLVVTPLAMVILAGTLLALCFSPFPGICRWLAVIPEYATRLLNRMMLTIGEWEGAGLSVVHFSVWQACLLAVLIGSAYLYFTRKRYRYLVTTLVVANLMLAFPLCRSLLPEKRRLCFTGNEVWICRNDEVRPVKMHSGMADIDTLNIAVLDDSSWKNRYADTRRTIHYLYLCRGFKGSLKNLLNVFEIGTVIIDSSMSDWWNERIRKECMEIGLDYVDISGQGSYTILL